MSVISEESEFEFSSSSHKSTGNTSGRRKNETKKAKKKSGKSRARPRRAQENVKASRKRGRQKKSVAEEERKGEQGVGEGKTASKEHGKRSRAIRRSSNRKTSKVDCSGSDSTSGAYVMPLHLRDLCTHANTHTITLS